EVGIAAADLRRGQAAAGAAGGDVDSGDEAQQLGHGAGAGSLDGRAVEHRDRAGGGGERPLPHRGGRVEGRGRLLGLLSLRARGESHRSQDQENRQGVFHLGYLSHYSAVASTPRRDSRRRAASSRSRPSHVAIPSPVRAEVSCTSIPGRTSLRLCSASSRAKPVAAARSILVISTRSAPLKMVGYLSGLTTPAVTERSTARRSSPRS